MIFDHANPFEVGGMEARRMVRDAAGTVAERRDGDTDAGFITLRGYAAKFNLRSEVMFGFSEIISPGAFDGVLQDDVRALFNHDPNMLLGRTVSGTCRINADTTGLFYEVDLPGADYAVNLAESVTRGDITQSSFAFNVAPGGEHWSENPDGTWLRTILKMDRLYDVSPVTYAAYPDATVSLRSNFVKQQVDAHAATAAAAVKEARAIQSDSRLRQLALTAR